MHGSPFVAADYAEQTSHGSPSSTSVWMALTLHGSGNTEPCVDQRPNPLRRTPRRSNIDRETVPTATVDRPFARGRRAATTSAPNAPESSPARGSPTPPDG